MSKSRIDRVEKPWGYEFRISMGPKLTLTYLTIFPESQTSLHCHPRKTTSLTAIAGKGKIKFLKDSIDFSLGASFMVRNGLFHQISNSGIDNLTVLEFENPSDEMDLVRLEDTYGRRLTRYEDKSKLCLLSKSEEEFFNQILQRGTWSNGEIEIKTVEPTRMQIMFNEEAVFAVLEGGLRDTKSNSLILRPADCITTSTIQRLINHFEWDITTKLLQIKKMS